MNLDLLVAQLMTLRETLKLQDQIIARLLEEAQRAEDEPDEDACPGCGSTELEPTPDFDNPTRITCLGCGRSFQKET